MHPMVILPNGDGVQAGLGESMFLHPAASRTRGRLGDRSVCVATAARLIALRQGDPLRDVDRHDLELLKRLVHP